MKKIFIFAFACIAFAACQPKLIILHTNDTHSHFDPVRGGRNNGKGGIIERAAFVDSVRARYGDDKVLLLHAGDFNQGTTYHSELKGKLEPLMMNALRYDCVTLGNHELDEGIESLAERLGRTDAPVVCANCIFPDVLQQHVKPYVIMYKAGLKIGIIGMESDIASMVAHPIASRIRQLDNVDTIMKYAPMLKNQEKCDLVILLSHLGYGEDIKVARMTKGIDIIIGGHTHTFVEGFKYVVNQEGKKIPIITDGCWGLEMGEIKVRNSTPRYAE